MVLLRARNSLIRSVPEEWFDPPAKQERPHEEIAQITIGLHEGQQLVAIELDHGARIACAYLSGAAGDRTTWLPRP